MKNNNFVTLSKNFPLIYLDDKRIKYILESSIETFGIDTQAFVMIEEVSELGKILCKIIRKGSGFSEQDIEPLRFGLADEIADNFVVLQQFFIHCNYNPNAELESYKRNPNIELKDIFYTFHNKRISFESFLLAIREDEPKLKTKALFAKESYRNCILEYYNYLCKLVDYWNIEKEVNDCMITKINRLEQRVENNCNYADK